MEGHLLDWWSIFNRVEDYDEKDNVLRLLIPVQHEDTIFVIHESITRLGYKSITYPNNPNTQHIQVDTNVPKSAYEKHQRIILALKTRFDSNPHPKHTFEEHLHYLDNAFKQI